MSIISLNHFVWHKRKSKETNCCCFLFYWLFVITSDFSFSLCIWKNFKLFLSFNGKQNCCLYKKDSNKKSEDLLDCVHDSVRKEMKVESWYSLVLKMHLETTCTLVVWMFKPRCWRKVKLLMLKITLCSIRCTKMIFILICDYWSLSLNQL